MRRLIAITSCQKFRDRIGILRATWLPEVRDADVRIFMGQGAEARDPEDVLLDVPDDYEHLRHKVQAAFAWSVEHGYDYTLKVDDDVLVLPDRLKNCFCERDYVGRVRGPSRENIAPRIYGNSETNFCSGFGYVLSRRAAEIVAASPDNGDWAEDRYVGNMLARKGIRATNDATVLLWPPLSGHFCHVPNGNCKSCIAQYAAASILCPHRRPEVIPVLWKSYKETGFVPTFL